MIWVVLGVIVFLVVALVGWCALASSARREDAYNEIEAV